MSTDSRKPLTQAADLNAMLAHAFKGKRIDLEVKSTPIAVVCGIPSGRAAERAACETCVAIADLGGAPLKSIMVVAPAAAPDFVFARHLDHQLLPLSERMRMFFHSEIAEYAEMAPSQNGQSDPHDIHKFPRQHYLSTP